VIFSYISFSNSPETVQKMADIIRRQMLAIGCRQALSPVMDVCRDPRWGRIGETYGEDPTLCAAMSVAFTRGLQGENLAGGVAAADKHFLAYGCSDGGLNMATNPVPPRELREVYAKPFQAAISEAGLLSIMNSYGVIDGEMVAASKHILTDLLRDEMGFTGLVVSDYMSIDQLVDRRLAVEMGLSRSLGDMAGLAQDLPGMESGDAFVPAEPFPGSTVLREHPAASQALAFMYGQQVPTILACVRSKCPHADITYAQGCDIAGTDRGGFDAALQAARGAEVVILTLGGKYGWGSSCTIGEGIDSSDIGLPGVQEDLAKAIYETGVKTVLVHIDARPLSSVFIAEHYPAIIENWFPGITGGEALADVLFGDYNPAGRLPATCARNAGQIPIYAGQYRGNSYRDGETKRILSRYCDESKEPLFCFGHGLSYTEFTYRDLRLTGNTRADGAVEVRCRVKNTGPRDGEEVVQLYVSDEAASMLRPWQELAGFARIFLKAGEEKTLGFTIQADQFAFLDSSMRWIVEEGYMTLRVGGSSRNLPLEGRFHIDNTAEIIPARRGFYAKAALS
jgi:hypothetical protein